MIHPSTSCMAPGSRGPARPSAAVAPPRVPADTASSWLKRWRRRPKLCPGEGWEMMDIWWTYSII